MFQVGGVTVQVFGADGVPACLVSSLVPFQVQYGKSDIQLRIEWVDELLPSLEDQVFDSGSVWRAYERGAGFQFDFSAPIFGSRPYKRLLVGRDFSQGTLQLSAESFGSRPSVAPLDYPLDELLIMHRLTQEKAIELHSCGIVRADGVGNLFVGHSGAGKSTTTRLWTEREDVEVLSDDRIILRREKDNATPASHCKLRMYGTPWHGEAMYASPNSAPLAKIFILEHGRGNVLTRLSRSRAVAELFARSFVPFHRHEYVASSLEFLQEVVEAVPCYRYAFEPDQAAVERILEFRD